MKTLLRSKAFVAGILLAFSLIALFWQFKDRVFNTTVTFIGNDFSDKYKVFAPEEDHIPKKHRYILQSVNLNRFYLVVAGEVPIILDSPIKVSDRKIVFEGKSWSGEFISWYFDDEFFSGRSKIIDNTIIVKLGDKKTHDVVRFEAR